MTTLRISTVVALVPALFALGCGLPSESDLGKACGPDVECKEPLVCNAGTCAPAEWDLDGEDGGIVDGGN